MILLWTAQVGPRHLQLYLPKEELSVWHCKLDTLGVVSISIRCDICLTYLLFTSPSQMFLLPTQPDTLTTDEGAKLENSWSVYKEF